ncbi:MAG: hypothetical protein JRI80_18540 [Deltaproteobacteria bacterium]|nr:hypothetical protein [Deltaproteobacteria bacterium]
MDFIKNARIRIEHWITHNNNHKEEYEAFAEQLEEEGKNGSSEYVRKMIEMTVRSNEYLRNALKTLE